MSGNNYGYYYPQATSSYPEKQWSEWSIEQQQYNNANFIRTPSYDTSPVTHAAHATHASTHIPPRAHYYSYHNSPQSNSRSFHVPRRYNNGSHQYSSSQPSWNRSSNYKRPRLDSEDNSEPKSKSSKKKKKPLSQNVPSKKDWTMDDAEKALNCEKEYNKRHKNQSLIIKFPDLELNKDIVSKFHNSIENVHFQQPSTARFCFVTLEENVDANSVISALNETKFGDGFLTAEYKKDREEDQNIGPEDIDPHTLYVGNLAQEITKEDMVKTYPKCKRIDIGYAKKMKYTRYAFVTFKSVTDSVEAFKMTHSTQMYSKSLIVRFRRLHGTVGMPGESKPQNPPKNKDSCATDETAVIELGEHTPTTDDGKDTEESEQTATTNVSKDADKSARVLSVKQEPESSDEGSEVETATNVSSESESNHKPTIKAEVKDEPIRDFRETDYIGENGDMPMPKFKFKLETDAVKSEPDDELFSNNKENGSSEDENVEKEDSLNEDLYFSKLYANMMVQASNVISKTGP